jgi:transposase
MIAAYGASQRLFQSGTSVRGKSHICKLGMGQVRRLLYLCTWSAVKVNLPCQRLYERLLERGKPKMLALIAVANKLLRQAFAMARHQTKFKDFKPAACFYTQFILEGSRVFKAKPKLLKIANDRS